MHCNEQILCTKVGLKKLNGIVEEEKKLGMKLTMFSYKLSHSLPVTSLSQAKQWNEEGITLKRIVHVLFELLSLLLSSY
jgi:hypothetical protein